MNKFVGKERNNSMPVDEQLTRFLENFKIALTLADKIKQDGTITLRFPLKSIK